MHACMQAGRQAGMHASFHPSILPSILAIVPTSTRYLIPLIRTRLRKNPPYSYEGGNRRSDLCKGVIRCQRFCVKSMPEITMIIR